MAKEDFKNGIKQKNSVIKEDIKEGLRQVGLGNNDTVLVHSSLSSFGYVEGGADTVIDALLETIGPSGTLVVPTFTWDDFHNKDKVVFDLVNTLSESGKITEVFRKRESVIRSTQICHSVAATGPHARDVMGDGISAWGKGSSFEVLYQLDSWNLLLGVNFNACTALHMVEEFMQVPYRAYRDFQGSQVILPDGTTIPSQSVEFLRQDGSYNDFGKMGEIFSQEGILKTCQIGEAKITNARIRDIFNVGKKYLEKDIYFLTK